MAELDEEIEALAQHLWASEENSTPWAEARAFHKEYRGIAKALWNRGCRYVGPGEAVVPRVLTHEMDAAIGKAHVSGPARAGWQYEWTAALVAAEASDG